MAGSSWASLNRSSADDVRSVLASKRSSAAARRETCAASLVVVLQEGVKTCYTLALFGEGIALFGVVVPHASLSENPLHHILAVGSRGLTRLGSDLPNIQRGFALVRMCLPISECRDRLGLHHDRLRSQTAPETASRSSLE